MTLVRNYSLRICINKNVSLNLPKVTYRKQISVIHCTLTLTFNANWGYFCFWQYSFVPLMNAVNET